MLTQGWAEDVEKGESGVLGADHLICTSVQKPLQPRVILLANVGPCCVADREAQPRALKGERDEQTSECGWIL